MFSIYYPSESSIVFFYDHGNFAYYSFKVYREAYLVAGDYPDQSIYMMQHLFNNWFRDLSLDKLAVGAVINTAIFVVLIWGFWKGWGQMDE